jgi:hypothetical protein
VFGLKLFCQQRKQSFRQIVHGIEQRRFASVAFADVHRLALLPVKGKNIAAPPPKRNPTPSDFAFLRQSAGRRLIFFWLP